MPTKHVLINGMNNEGQSLKDFILLPENFGPLPQPRAQINGFASDFIVVVPYKTSFIFSLKLSFLKVPSLLQILLLSFFFFQFLIVTVISEEFSA